MATASSCSPRLQAVSHGAGHTREVNSGNGLVIERRSAASRMRPRHKRSFVSGMRLCSGQPVARLAPAKTTPLWQKATPQAMQRAAWACCAGKSSTSTYSSKSRTASFTARRPCPTRPCFRYAPGMPIYAPLLIVSNASSTASSWLAPRFSACAVSSMARSYSLGMTFTKRLRTASKR